MKIGSRLKKRKLFIYIGLGAILISGLAGYGVSVLNRRRVYYVSPPGAGRSDVFCGLTAVATICSLNGIDTNIGTIYRHAGAKRDEGTTLANCHRALEELGVPCEAVRFESTMNLPEGVPILYVVRRKEGLHSIVVVRRGDKALVIDGQRSDTVSTDWLDRVTANVGLVPR